MTGEDGFAAGWQPKAGDRIEGRITSLDVRYGEYGSYPVVTLATGNGEAVAFHAFHEVPKRELTKRRPQVGDRLKVAYHGMKGKRDGSKFAAYAIETPDRPPPPFRWGAFASGDAYAEEPLPEAEQPEEDAGDDDVPF